MSAWGLIGQMLAGGAVGYSKAGLNEIEREAEQAREEGLIRLRAELQRDNLVFQADRDDARAEKQHERAMDRLRITEAGANARTAASSANALKRLQMEIGARKDAASLQRGHDIVTGAMNNSRMMEVAKMQANSPSAQVKTYQYLEEKGVDIKAFAEGEGKISAVDKVLLESWAKDNVARREAGEPERTYTQFKIDGGFGSVTGGNAITSLGDAEINRQAEKLMSAPKEKREALAEDIQGKVGAENMKKILERVIELRDANSLSLANEHHSVKPQAGGNPILSPKADAIIQTVIQGGRGVPTTEFGTQRDTADDERKSFIRARPY